MPEPTSTEVVTTRVLAPDTYRSAGTIEELVSRRGLIEQVMSRMVEGVHYGKIPGTDKPALLKPGAEWLDNLFRFRPEFRRDVERDGDHVTVTTYCTLVHIPSGDVLVKDAVGVCTTRESKYAWRQGDRECPECGAAAIFRSKHEDKAGDKGWYCWAKRGGCGAKFLSMDERITSQSTERKPNPDLADQYNTVYKMSEKRSHVGGTLTATAASDMFTQDEDAIPARPDEPEVTHNGGQRQARSVSQSTPVSHGGDFDPNPAPEKPAGKEAIPGVDPAANPLLGAVNDLAGKLELTGAGVANIATKLFKRTVEAKDLPGLPEADAERLSKDLEVRWTARQAQR